MHTFVKDGAVFVSPNTSIPPPAIVEEALLGESDLALFEAHKFRFISPDYPQLPFTLCSPVNHGPLFSCLSYTHKSLPIVRLNCCYQLEPALLARWTALDDFLTDVFNVLQVYAPMNVILNLVPRETRYTKPRTNEKSARGAASHALRRFQHLISMVSWAICGYTGLDRPDPEWAQILLRKGFEPSMVQMLRESPVGTFSPEVPRVGTIVRTSDVQCLMRVRRMALAHVPVYIYWGYCDTNAKRFFKNLTSLEGRWVSENCYPSDEDLAKAVKLALSVGPSVPERRFPRPDRGSRQKLGETWQQFFERRTKDNKETEARETPTQLQARLARAKHASAGRALGKKGAVVFQWINEDNFRMRRNIGRDDASFVWDSYSGGQKRYDPFADEWDICTEFDPDAPPEEDPLEVDDDDFEPQSPVPANTAVNPSAHHTSTFVGGTIPTSDSPEFPLLEDILYTRYGFVGSPSDQPAHCSKTITELALSICEGEASPPLSSTVRKVAVAFIARLIDGQPLSACDMMDGSLHDQYESGDVIVERREGARIALGGGSTPNVFYLIRFRQIPSSPFSICLDDPVAVLQIIRAQFGTDPPALALQLASRGIPFNTCIISNTQPTPISLKVPRGLGFLPFRYRPRPSDYNSYLDRRDRLLRRGYARAALIKGGIIARLARDSIGDRMDVLVGLGPSEDYIKYGAAIRIGTEYLWDDELDPDDEQVICGVYKISTGQRHPSQGEQTSDISWWPKQSTWEASGLDVGYWSKDDEIWFQKHLEAIRSYRGEGPPPCYSATEWRNKLKCHRANKVAARARADVEKWLSSNL